VARKRLDGGLARRGALLGLARSFLGGGALLGGVGFLCPVDLRSVGFDFRVADGLFVDGLGVEGERPPRDESGQENDDAAGRHEDAGGVDHGGPHGLQPRPVRDHVRAAVLRGEVAQVGVHDLAHQGRQDGEHDDVQDVQERHHGAEGRRVAVDVVDLGEPGLDVRDERDVAGGPPEGHEGHDAEQNPDPGVGAADGTDAREDPDDRDGEGVDAQPGERRRHGPREQEDEERAEELPEVGAGHEPLLEGAAAEADVRVLGEEDALEVAVENQRQGVRRDQPDQRPLRQDQVGADADGVEEGSEDRPRLLREREPVVDGLQAVLPVQPDP
ncbi:MAG: hypothetical protein BJ554DRAFT_8036, partial [Olpidium bornovanus]